MMAHRGDGNDQVDEQECVNVIRCFLGGRINDPVAHGESNLSWSISVQKNQNIPRCKNSGVIFFKLGE